MNKTLKFLWINFLWFLFSIPVITIGGATSAAIYVSLKLAGKDNLSADDSLSAKELFKLFFKSFKENFLQGIAALIFSAITMGLTGFVWYKIIDNDIYNIFILFIVVICTLVIVSMNCYVYSMIAHYKNSFVNFMKNSVAVTFTFYKWSLKMSFFVILELCVLAFLFWLNPFAGIISLIFWPSTIFFAVSNYSAKTFYQLENPPVYEEDAEEESDEDDDSEGSDDDESDDSDETDDSDEDDSDEAADAKESAESEE